MNRPTADDPTGADRKADIVLGAAGIIVRTMASTAAFGSLAWAPVLRGRTG